MQSSYSLTFAKLRHLVAVGDMLNLTRAAERLNISQPALSRSIISIEQTYGFAIFDRRPSGLALTDLGKSVVEEASVLLERVRSYDHTLRLYGTGDVGRIAFGIAPQLASMLLPKVGKDLFGNSPRISARTLIRPTEILIAALRNDEIDFCFVAEERAKSEGVVFSQIGVMRAGFFVRKGHPLARRKKVTFEEFAEFTLGGAAEIHPPSIAVEKINMIQCDNFDILRSITLGSDLICIFSKEFIGDNDAHASLVELHVREFPRIENPIYVASLEGRAFSPIANRISDLVHKIVRRFE